MKNLLPGHSINGADIDPEAIGWLRDNYKGLARFEESFAPTPTPVRVVLKPARALTVRVTDARFTVRGLNGRVAGKAVTLRIKLVDDQTGASVVLTHTAHAVSVAGRWRWILPPERIGLYSSGACTTPEPSP